ncbi:MAG: acyltransferase family protein [Rhodoglobus sp.]
MTSRITPPPPAQPRRIAGLDGMRAIAVIAVIGYHFFPQSLSGGFVGVDIFFVISGFLITGLLVREHDSAGRIVLGRFWIRRVRRLVPALVMVVAVCSGVALLIGGDVLLGIGPQIVGAATFSSNWLFIAEGTNYFNSFTPELFRNLWSLAVEEQFYLLWPALIMLVLMLRRRWLRVVIPIICSIASVIAMALLGTENATRAYYGTDTHSFGLTLGASLAFILQARFTGTADPARSGRISRLALPALGALCILGIIVISTVLSESSPLTTQGALALVAILTALAIIGATTPQSWLGRALDTAPVVWIGERSYGLYLWHWPVLVLVGAALPAAPAWWVIPTLSLVLTTLAAGLSYRFVELPIRQLGLRGALTTARNRRTPVRLVAAGAALGLSACALLAGAAVAADTQRSQAQIAVEQGQTALAQPGYAHAPRRPQPPPTGDQMLAIGDSVMLAATPELQETYPGIQIDAAVSRQMFEAEDIVANAIAAGTLRPVLVIGLGTNGWIERQDLENIHTMVGRSTRIIVVNVQAPREWVPEVNNTLADFARRERTVELSNWHDAIQPQLDVLADDEVHPGATGARIYITALTEALQRLAELPPVQNSNGYRFSVRAV